MPDKTANWGVPGSGARYRTQDSDPTGGGNFVVAERLDSNGDPVDVLLEWDETADEWKYGGPVNLDGSDVTNVGAFDADSVTTAQFQNITWLDNNDPDRPDVDDYLNSNVLNGETVAIAAGTHTVNQISLISGCTIYWFGTLEPAGDHPVLQTDAGASYVTINPGGGRDISTTNQATYTSDALVLNSRFRTTGVMSVQGTGRRVVNVEQRSGDNLNHTAAILNINGADEADVGLMVDNSSGGAPNCNNMRIEVRNCRACTAYGCYINAGIGNKYSLSADSNDRGIAFYSGGGPRGSGSTEGDISHRRVNAVLYSDGSNTNPDQFGDGVTSSLLQGSINGNPGGLAPSSVYQDGGRFRSSKFGQTRPVTVENSQARTGNNGESVGISLEGNDYEGALDLDSDFGLSFESPTGAIKRSETDVTQVTTTSTVIGRADVGALITVVGVIDGGVEPAFTDTVNFSRSGGVTVIAQEERGAAATRTYTEDGSGLELAMGSETYNVQTHTIDLDPRR